MATTKCVEGTEIWWEFIAVYHDLAEMCKVKSDIAQNR